jgi:hypothetical protein
MYLQTVPCHSHGSSLQIGGWPPSLRRMLTIFIILSRQVCYINEDLSTHNKTKDEKK